MAASVRAAKPGRATGSAAAPELVRTKPSAAQKRGAQFRLSARRLDDTGNVVIPGANESPRAPRGSITGLGAGSGGQSGDLQGLRGAEVADSESVAELAEDGQAYEAEVVDGVENVPDADQGEVKTHERPEDNDREEYDEDNR
ncbi:MAG: hypothetical protein WA879_08455 [Candidatus Acidiferrales bacterium]